MPNNKPITRYSVWFFDFDFPATWSFCGPFSFHKACEIANEFRRYYPLVKVVALK